MPVPDFITQLHQKIGHDPLWLPKVTAAIVRRSQTGPKVLLVRQATTGRWTPIGGCIEPGEDPDLAAVREVREETGLKVVLDRLVWIRALPQSTLHNGDSVQFLEIAMRGRPLDDTAPLVVDDEFTAVDWFSVDALPPLLDRHYRLIQLALDDDGGPAFGQDERKLT